MDTHSSDVTHTFVFHNLRTSLNDVKRERSFFPCCIFLFLILSSLCLYLHYKTPMIWAGHSRALFYPVTGFSVTVQWKHKGAFKVTTELPLLGPAVRSEAEVFLFMLQEVLCTPLEFSWFTQYRAIHISRKEMRILYLTDDHIWHLLYRKKRVECYLYCQLTEAMYLKSPTQSMFLLEFNAYSALQI